MCKGRGGGFGALGLRQINTCRKVPLQVNFLTFCVAFYEYYLSTVQKLKEVLRAGLWCFSEIL